jgi:pterin-4a-carbinolamine dehydratase
MPTETRVSLNVASKEYKLEQISDLIDFLNLTRVFLKNDEKRVYRKRRYDFYIDSIIECLQKHAHCIAHHPERSSTVREKVDG